MNKGKYIWGVLIFAALVGLFMWPRLNDSNRELKKSWAAADVNCLVNGHTRTNLHIHPHIAIFVDGSAEEVPANIGIVRDCMSEVHTHDASGTIHVESLLASKEFTLNDFFTVWGKSLERAVYSLEMSVDGLASIEGGGLILKDKQEIVLEYKKTNQ